MHIEKEQVADFLKEQNENDFEEEISILRERKTIQNNS